MHTKFSYAKFAWPCEVLCKTFAPCMKFPLYMCSWITQLWPTLSLDTHLYYSWQLTNLEPQLLYKMILAIVWTLNELTVDLCVTFVYWKLLLVIMFYLLWRLYSIDNSSIPSMLLFMYMYAHTYTCMLENNGSCIHNYAIQLANWKYSELLFKQCLDKPTVRVDNSMLCVIHSWAVV